MYIGCVINKLKLYIMKKPIMFAIPIGMISLLSMGDPPVEPSYCMSNANNTGKCIHAAGGTQCVAVSGPIKDCFGTISFPDPVEPEG